MASPRLVSIWLALGVAIPGCSPGGAACAGPTCGAGYECLANRCAVAGGVPVPRDSERVVLSPIELVTSARSSAPEVTLASSARRDSFVLARFGSGYKDGSEIAAAFLLLTVTPGTAPVAEDVPLDVWMLDQSWSADSVARGSRPGFSRPVAHGIARTSPTLPVRVDVTHLVRELARNPGDDGLGVVASGASGATVTLVTAAAGAPRLEVYLARPRRAQAAW
jgi:hypothetical protein